MGSKKRSSNKAMRPADWRLATKLVQGGLARSEFSETCEAIFMTSGYVYASAEEAEAAFANKKARFIYSRFGNPTVQMFEQRMALLEGTEAARATATGMAAVFASLMSLVRTGDRVVSSAPITATGMTGTWWRALRWATPVRKGRRQ